jgi:NAD(P)-dependent dehydrogenase (short-subunit alcohol dehydrogenase family)
MEQSNIENKVVVITGGTSGMGYDTAKLFLQKGAKVVIAGRKIPEGTKAEEELSNISPEIRFIQADVSKEADVKHLIEETVNIFGRLDIAFNNAGVIGEMKPTDLAQADDFDEVIGINLKGAWLCAKYEIIQFKKQQGGGAIINTSSWLAKGVFPGTGIYSASKAGLDGLTRVLAVETAPFGIRVNNINPGFIDTPIMKPHFPDEASKAPLKKQVPLARLGYGEDIAALVVWLGSDSSSYITGQNISIDGGLTIPGQRS